MSTCDTHGCRMYLVEVREYPGKTIEQCPQCESERHERMEVFRVKPEFPSLYQMRHAMSSALNPPMDIQITRLSTGYFLIRAGGINNWVQTPYWPADEETIRRFAFPEAGEDFLREVIRRAKSWWDTADETR